MAEHSSFRTQPQVLLEGTRSGTSCPPCGYSSSSPQRLALLRAAAVLDRGHAAVGARADSPAGVAAEGPPIADRRKRHGHDGERCEAALRDFRALVALQGRRRAGREAELVALARLQ